MSHLLLLLIALSAPASKNEAKDKPRTAVSATLVLKVADREATADALIDATEKLDGYFATRTDDQVILKVPVKKIDAIVALVESKGVIVERSYAADDVGGRLDELRTRLRSRREVLNRYFSVLNQAPLGSVVQVESQMTQLVEEIEGLRGTIRLIEHQLEFAQVNVRFQFRERRAPKKDGSSSFAWLNTVNIADLFEEFANVR